MVGVPPGAPTDYAAGVRGHYAEGVKDHQLIPCARAVGDPRNRAQGVGKVLFCAPDR